MKKSLLLMMALIATTVGSAQNQNASKIKVYTPSTSQSKSSVSDNTYKWAVKADVFSFVSGEIPVAFEYRFAPKLSVEASAGLTYGLYQNGSSLFGEEDGTITSIDTKAAMGSAFRGTLKFYPSSDYDAIEGWYFGLQVFNKVNNRDYVPTSNPDEAVYAGKKDKKVKTGLSIMIGKQIFQDSNVVFDSYIGVGLASVTRDFYGRDYNSSNDAVMAQSTKETVPNFTVGFKIGFGN